MEKIYTSISDQINILKSRGVLFDNLERTTKILAKHNYYSVVNGYKGQFLQQNSKDERFIAGTRFDELFDLYLLDQSLRILFLEYILIIESNIKSLLSYVFSEQYGHKDYLKFENFENDPIKKRKTDQHNGDIMRLISNINFEISRQLKSNNPTICHYIQNYGHVPLWVIIHKLSFGTICDFYDLLKEQDKNNISRVYHLLPDELNNILYVLRTYRNICAHNERFYNFKVKNRLKESTIAKSSLFSSNSSQKNSDLFSVVISFKLLLEKKDFELFTQKLKTLLSPLHKKITTIDSELIFREMGFPSDLNFNK